MSPMKRLAKFVAEEVAKTMLSAVGQHVGDAVGNLLGKRIDPKHGLTPKDEPEKSEEPAKGVTRAP